MTNSSSQPSLRKVLGVPDGVAILIGITIGAGIYSTPQIIADYMSSFTSIILLWLLVGVFVFIGSLIYAELGSRLPNTGGEYVYISRCFGPYLGFMFGWAQLFIIKTSPAAGLALITANYLEYFVELSDTAHTLVALTVIALFGTLNYVGINRASIYQKGSTALKVGGLFFLVIAGLILVGGHENLIGTRAPATSDLGPVGAAVAAMMLIVFTHTGWDRVGYPAGEMKDPKRAIPLTMFIGMGLIIFLYWSANFIYYRTLGIEGLRQSTIVASDVATQLIGPVGAAFTALLVMISTTGSINGTMMTAPRAYYAMAKDGLFFKWLDYVHPKYRTPSRAILAHCFWGAMILIVRRQFETIVAGMVFAILIFYTFTTLALFKLRREQPNNDVYNVPFYPALPAIYLLGIVTLLGFRAYYEWEKSLTDIAFIATGLPFAFIWCRKKATRLFDQEARKRLLTRIENLHPEAESRWGKMTAHEMVCHTSDQLRMALGEIPTHQVSGPLQYSPLKQVVIYWMPWPKGRIMSPRESQTNQPNAWNADVQTLCALVERFSARDQDTSWPDHPMFGSMSRQLWNALAYRHLDHHLRQFGV